MPRRALVLALLALPLLTPADALAQSGLPTRYTITGAAVFPEGIAVDPARRTLYVGATSDGTIYGGTLARPGLRAVLPPPEGRPTSAGLEIDARGRLWVAGGPSGRIDVYDPRARRLLGAFTTGTGGFMNDQVVTRGGDGYVTDSRRPVIWRVRASALGSSTPQPAERWLDLTGSAIAYGEGFNLNGIVLSADGRHLVVVQSNTGRLFRIEIATKEVTPIDLGGATVTFGDGMVLLGRTLYVLRNRENLVVKIRLRADLASGVVASLTTYLTTRYPTTAAAFGGRLLLVNSQFGARNTGTVPILPFTVSSVRRP